MGMAKYKLVNNTEYDLKGVYYGGLNEKYYDMFNICPESVAKVYTDLEEAKRDKEMLKRRFHYEHFEIETVKEIIQTDDFCSYGERKYDENP